MIAAPATALSPNCAMVRKTNPFPMGVARLVRTAGAAIANSGLISSKKLGECDPAGQFMHAGQRVPGVTQGRKTRGDGGPGGAPSRPQPKAKINTGSSTPLTREPIIVAHMERRASPIARTAAAMPMSPITSTGMKGNMILA